MQHVAYVRSGRSLAAHLTGLGIAIEHDSDPSLLRRVQQWLSRTPELAKPAMPAARGDITIDDVITAAPEDRHAVVGAWAASAWAAWAAEHALVRTWIAAALL